MNKFANSISKSGDSVKNERSSLLANQAKQKQTQLIQSLESQITDLKINLANLNDLSPETTDSLRPGGNNFSPDNWVSTNQRVKKQIMLLEIDLKVAQETFAEWFAEEATKA